MNLFVERNDLFDLRFLLKIISLLNLLFVSVAGDSRSL